MKKDTMNGGWFYVVQIYPYEQSLEPEAICFKSGLNATDVTTLLWPRNVLSNDGSNESRLSMTGARSSVMLMLPAACDSPTDLVDVNLDMWMYDVFCNTISNNPVQTVQ